MTDHPYKTPGTVSKILWHFTGGPKWSKSLQQQTSKKKSASEAYDALCSILQSQTVRLGNYSEVARVIIPHMFRWDPTKKKSIAETNVPHTLESSPVCCLADIPIPHLQYHEHRYGRFAIGFHRESAVESGFNPVLYTLEHMTLMRSLHTLLISLESAPIESAIEVADEILLATSDLEVDDSLELAGLSHDAVDEMSTVKRSINRATKSFQNLLAYVKTFDSKQFHSVYCEREWRSLNPFSFTYDDVAMILLPKTVARRQYYSEFITAKIKQLKLPRSVPVISWDDLIEH